MMYRRGGEREDYGRGMNGERVVDSHFVYTDNRWYIYGS